MSGQFCTLVMFEFSSALPSCVPQTISIIKRAFFSCNFTTSLLQCSKILTDYMIGYVGFALLLWILQPFSEWNLTVSDMIVALYQILHNTRLIDGESFQSLITVLIDISNYHIQCYILISVVWFGCQYCFIMRVQFKMFILWAQILPSECFCPLKCLKCWRPDRLLLEDTSFSNAPQTCGRQFHGGRRLKSELN